MTGRNRSYSQVKAQIAELEQEAETLRQQEVEAVLADIRAKVAEYGLTEQDVFGRKRGAAAKTRRPKADAAPKYRDPKTGATWTGRGRAPAWIVEAKNRNRFLIQDA
ncbi:H-NS histone family protein [Burkholderia cepacia]|uniref:H-NS histone family protein n=1 Tax=Burkholderia cepacia TaxID=292 RepID=A0AAX2RQH5_BURCE|nr:H-NS histone family protein [Burkholderia cepacia]TES62187.1 H-NS histone family protein [Burkholderia cepacia]TET01621.1 H-NS histone family protein [Burkholderia cepacia]TEU47479.1 H-NS histone family protein [Burkholderia cepacia]TEU53506.1 H-NS histone family protein [Burkholderia cepacia]TEV02112.1 H-NS histone family protein [Burkholderia cepacia]